MAALDSDLVAAQGSEAPMDDMGDMVSQVSRWEAFLAAFHGNVSIYCVRTGTLRTTFCNAVSSGRVVCMPAPAGQHCLLFTGPCGTCWGFAKFCYLVRSQYSHARVVPNSLSPSARDHKLPDAFFLKLLGVWSVP